MTVVEFGWCLAGPLLLAGVWFVVLGIRDSWRRRVDTKKGTTSSS